MKKSVIAIIISVAVIGLGLFACLAAVIFGFDPGAAFDDGTFNISTGQHQGGQPDRHGFGSENDRTDISAFERPVEIIDQGLEEIKEAVDGLGLVLYSPDDYWETRIADDYSDSGEYLIDTGNIREIKVNWVSGHINISVDDVKKISLRESGGSGREEALRYGYEEDSLRIFFCENGSGITTLSKDLEIIIPLSLAKSLGEISVDGVSASLTGKLDGFGGSLDFDSVSGGAYVSGDMAEVELDSVSGDAEFVGSCSELSFNGVSGSMTAELSTLPREIEADTTSGNVELTLPAGSAFELNFDTVSGDFGCDFAFHQSSDGRYSIGSGSKSGISVDSVSGDLTIWEK